MSGDPGRDRPRMRLVRFKSLVKGSLRGFATVELSIGLTIEDCPVLIGRAGAWATLPGRPVLDRDGRQVRADGRVQFAAILKWRDRELQNRFSAAVVELIRAHNPAALDEGGAP